MAISKKSYIYLTILGVVILVITALYFVTAGMFPKKYDAEIAEAAQMYDIDEDLIRAVIWTESKFKSDAVSEKGASGLMQMMPTTRAEQSVLSGVSADGSARSEILLGTGYLARMIKATKSVEDALMAYNAGLGNLLSWNKPFKESADYVDRVKFAYNIYKHLR